MQQMSRAQRILLMYLLLKSQEPRVIKKITRNYGSGIGKHGNDMHTTAYTSNEGAVGAVEAKDPLTLKKVVMTDDLDLAGNALLTTNLLINEQDAATLRVRDRADANYKYLRAAGFYAQLYRTANSTASILTVYNNNNGVFNLQGWKGAASTWDTVATIQSDATQPFFTVPAAGDITMLDQKMMKLGTYTDAQRPAAGTAGRWIFNTDDGMPNYDDGTNWRDINGNIT